MSKLEDKLTASIKPGKATVARATPAKQAATKAPAPRAAKLATTPAAEAKPVPAATDNRLHPRRVWPD